MKHTYYILYDPKDPTKDGDMQGPYGKIKEAEENVNREKLATMEVVIINEDFKTVKVIK